MKIPFIILLYIPIGISKDIPFKDIVDFCDKDGSGSYAEEFVYGVPYDASPEDFEKYIIKKDTKNNSITFPSGPKVDSSKTFPEMYRICALEENEFMASEAAKVYLTNLAVDVYQWRNETFNVKAGVPKYIVVFARNEFSGSTISNLNMADNSGFTLYSGLPKEDGNDEKDDPNVQKEDPNVLYVYNPSLKVDELYIREDHFHIEVTNGTFSFDVSDGGTNPSDKTFESNGFILSKGFPATLPDDEKSMKVKIQKKLVDTKITWQVTAAPANGTSSMEGQMEEMASGDEGVTIKWGENEMTLQPGSTTKSGLTLPAGTEEFQIEATTGYRIQFDIADPPKTTTTTKQEVSTTTTHKPNGEVTPCPACPPAVTCTSSPAPTTSTEPTTTQSASESAVASVLAIVFFYALL